MTASPETAQSWRLCPRALIGEEELPTLPRTIKIAPTHTHQPLTASRTVTRSGQEGSDRSMRTMGQGEPRTPPDPPQSALDGYPVCIFAYGQTGSGKTYTMEGPGGADPTSWGVIPRAVRHLFGGARQLEHKGWQYSFSASFLEIYNEALRDLLGGDRGGELEIRHVSSASKELHVPNLRCVPVASEDEVLGLLQTAASKRSVARTALNDRSSRSHCVFQLHIQGSNASRALRCSSVLSLVDLAGSERLDKCQASGQRLRETQAINSSLATLGLVIMAISNKEPHVPYRNSKLTYLLQNSLRGNAKMLMFVNISPLEENFAESLNSLRFASKVNECMVGTAHANKK
eukprot:XP_027304179.1 carboxy-terminal kinesin 2 [Anas platyrhynchos]